jgi:predicted RecA/RadA family phage recombinase
MATNFVKDGKIITHVALAAVSSGEVVNLASVTMGIALNDAAIGEDVEVAIEGVFNVVKLTGTAWVQGQILNWDESADAWGTATLSGSVGDFNGGACAANAVASTVLVGQIKLLQGTGTRVDS